MTHPAHMPTHASTCVNCALIGAPSLSPRRYEVDKLTASQRLDLNLEKGRMRDELQALRDKSNEMEIKVWEGEGWAWAWAWVWAWALT